MHMCVCMRESVCVCVCVCVHERMSVCLLWCVRVCFLSVCVFSVVYD